MESRPNHCFSRRGITTGTGRTAILDFEKGLIQDLSQDLFKFNSFQSNYNYADKLNKIKLYLVKSNNNRIMMTATAKIVVVITMIH